MICSLICFVSGRFILEIQGENKPDLVNKRVTLTQNLEKPTLLSGLA